MFIQAMDEHPGRCKNLRPHTHPDGDIEMLRCLELDSIQHQCRFPKPVVRSTHGQSWTTPVHPPKPWVPPPIEPNPVVGSCGACGLTLRQVMGYVCNRVDCPTGMGGVQC